MLCEKDQICVNTAGSYLCTCNAGFVYNTIQGTCDGIKLLLAGLVYLLIVAVSNVHNM